MKPILLCFLLSLMACASTQRVAENVFMADCDTLFGDCRGEMVKTCPDGFKVTAKHTRWMGNASRDYVHFMCNESVTVN